MTPRIAIVAAAIAALPAAPGRAADCPAGPSGSVVSPDGNASSFFFDDFSAATDDGPRTCRVRVRVPVTAPGGYTVFASDYRGFVSLEPGQTASVTTAGGRGGRVRIYAAKGAKQDDFTASGKIGSAGTDAVDLEIRLRADPAGGGDAVPGAVFLDTLDVARIGFTTATSVSASVDSLARQAHDGAIDFMEPASLLLGAYERVDGDSFVSLAAQGEFPSAGARGRWAGENGFSVLAGGAFVGASGPSSDGALLLAASLRYIQPGEAPWRGFAEAGIWGVPDADFRLHRTYRDLGKDVEAGGRASTSVASLYGRFGALYQPDAGDEVALSASLTRTRIGFDGYREGAGGGLFAATIDGGHADIDTIGAQAAWTHEVGRHLDFTAAGSVAEALGSGHAITADVDWVGRVRGAAPDRFLATLGGRVGWRFDRRWTVDATLDVPFRQGQSARADLGAALKARF